MAKNATMQEINDDAHILRENIDSLHEGLVDWAGVAHADAKARPLYDAVTRLHELATITVQKGK